MNTYLSFKKALVNVGVPVLFLDLEAFEKNLAWIKDHAGEKKIRIATKSIRSKDILKRILDTDPIFQGLMTYDLREALWLRQEGFKDILMGYPTVDEESLVLLAKRPGEITLMVDLPEHLTYLEQIASSHNSSFSICVDIDLSMDLPGLRFGVYRSRNSTLGRLRDFISVLKKCPHLKLTGLMGYEAQIAGVMDKESLLIRWLKKFSLKQFPKRRFEMVELLRKEGFSLSLVNGGGTGSLLTTRLEDQVTEITIGSGIYSPVLFDHYKDFKLSPSLFFSLPIVRLPEKNIYTCLGGGYIASGSTDKIKMPTPYLPQGAKLLTNEGAGEVQTPVLYKGEIKLGLGDPVIMRHAKAGEVCERFERMILIKNQSIVGEALTYRGEGQTFV
jgi:D-serine deaminase-like pyridoxal phosphate-dependent protein